jgi:predicted phosphohydrolase
MSSVLIVHLSDFHVQASDAHEWTAERAYKIARSCVRTGPYKQVIIVCSGDIAFSGRVSEFEIAEKFFLDIVSEVEKLSGCSVKLVLCPGNHDCNFDEKSKLRTLARENPSNEAVHDSEMLEKLASPLSNYRVFESRIETFHFSERTVVQKNGLLECDGIKIQIRVLTSPLYSDIQEKKGDLFLPVGILENDWCEDCFRIVVMHHPPAWFKEIAGRPIRTAIRAHAHLVLYGHEHVPEIAQVTTSSHGMATEVVEVDGAVLHEHSGSDQSSFITLEIDTSTDAVEALAHHWVTESSCFSTIALSRCERGTGWIRLPRKTSTFSLKPSFQERLRDPGISFSSSAAREIFSKDLYVYPELSEPIRIGSSQEAIFVASKLKDPQELRTGIVLQGDEKSGKTALLYRLFESYHEAGYVPLLVSLRDHKIKNSSDFRKIIETSIKEIYTNLGFDTFSSVPKERRVYLFDDIDTLSKPTLREELVNLLKAQSEYFVATTTMRTRLTEVLTDDSAGAVGDIRQAKIARMSSVMRAQLIANWVKNVECVSDEEFFIARIDQLGKSAAVTLGHNLVPRVPHMLLIFLQSCSAASSSKLESGALGHYYQYLITQYLIGVGIKVEELDEPISFARIVAYKMHASGKNYITYDELAMCNREFDEEFIPGPLQTRINILVNAKLLIELGSDSFQWREPYAQYLFLGGYLSHNLEKPQVRATVRDMVEHLYVRSNANALLFLVHYSKDTTVFQDLTHVIQNLFKNDKPLKLGDDTRDFAGFIEHANELVSTADPLKERESRNESKDARGAQEDGLADMKNSGEVLTLLEEITILFKSSEIIGQVLKEQYASISRATREPIVTALLDAYLRASGGIMRKMALNKELMQIWIEKMFLDNPDVLTKSEKTLAAQKFISQLVEMFMFVFFQKLADGIASDKTLDLVRHIKWPDELEPKVLLLACELNIQKSIPFGQIDLLVKAAEGDPAFLALIRNLVQTRISLFHTRAQDIQSLSSRFKLDVKKVNAVEFVGMQKR